MNILPRKFETAKAASMASNARHARRVGASLYCGSKLLSIGYNSYNTSHPKAGEYYNNLHAEHRCIIRRQYYPNKCNLSIYIYRELNDGTLACSKPCDNCMVLLREAGVKTAYFFDPKGEIQSLKIG